MFEKCASASALPCSKVEFEIAVASGDGGDVARKAVYCPPTLAYQDRIALNLDDLTLHCRHGLGETDDHTWLWLEDRKALELLAEQRDQVVESLDQREAALVEAESRLAALRQGFETLEQPIDRRPGRTRSVGWQSPSPW